MAARRMINRLYYFTIEDESILAESFAQLEKEVYAITYTLLAEEDGARIAIYHSPLSREELGDYEDALKALALAWRAIAAACVGVNCEPNLGFDLRSHGAKSSTYFTAPAGHTFIWRLFRERDEAVDSLGKLTGQNKKAVE